MDRFLPIVPIIGWFAAVFTASYLINWLLIRSVIRRYYRLFVAPGVIVHELSHAVGCLVTGSPIVEINFWKASGGHVKHLQSTDPFRRMISDPIIALAPIGGTLALLAALSWWMTPEIFDVIGQADISTIVKALDLAQWQTWAYLYLVTSLAATIAPSATDMHYALASLVVLAILLVILLYLPGFAEWLAELGQTLQPFALFTLFLLAVGILVAFLLAIPNRGQHLATRWQIE